MGMRLQDRPIKIAIIAMGGQGGGVLSKWIIDLAESEGFVAQYTSVPGVAQRTGATIYYIELFPLALIEQSGKQPVMALTPVEGDVDIVIASEMMEVGRALMRGFVTAKTTLIGSAHRDYAITEKQEMGDGRRPTAEVEALARESAGRFICSDMDKVARESGTVISSVLFGALCASAALPFTREQFEETIRKEGKAVSLNLKGLAAGIDAAGGIDIPLSVTPRKTADLPENLDSELVRLVGELRQIAPGDAFELAVAGLSKVVDFQDIAYGSEYVDLLRQVREIDRAYGGSEKRWALTETMARYLALAMAYEDVIRVADIKTRSGRFENFREDVKAAEGQIVHVREFMHPRWQEICEILPKSTGRYLLNSHGWTRLTRPLFSTGRRIPTTSLWGFTMLFLLGRMRNFRRRSLRFAVEQERIGQWFDAVLTTAKDDYSLAIEIAGLQRLIKGYGDTHEQGLRNYGLILASLPVISCLPDPAGQVRQLKRAALNDDTGASLLQMINDNKRAA